MAPFTAPHKENLCRTTRILYSCSARKSFLSREGRHEDIIKIPDAEIRAEINKTITETILAWAEMPMAPVPKFTFDFLQQDIEQFLHGILTPQEAAQRMHNRVALWLIE